MRSSVWSLVLAGCVGSAADGSEAPVAPPAPRVGEVAGLRQAEALALQGAVAWRGAVTRTQVTSGREVAAARCAEEVPLLLTRLATDARQAMGRVSVRETQPPVAGLADWLAAHADDRAADVSPWTGIVPGPEGPLAAVAVPMGRSRTCAGCHGRSSRRDGGLVGVPTGGLLGAVWAMVPVRAVGPPARSP